MARIKYLSELEIKKFEKAPEFENNIERNYYFTLPSSIHKQALTFGNDQSFIFFTLIFGYFKATNMFFELNSFSSIDTKFISDKYQLSTFDPKTIFASRTVQRYKQLIKAHLGVNEYSNDIELKLQNHAIELANNFTHRKKIFFSLVDYSKKLNIEIPSQFTLSKIIGTALTFQTKHILLLLRTYQKDKRLKILDEFVNKDENFKNRYYLSNYRKLGHSTNKREMNSSVFYLKNMKSKFHILKPIIDEIGITSKISQYYARWLEQSKITQLTQKDLLNNHFLLLSFVKYQYFIRNDNIIDRFISIIQSTKSSILRHQKDLYFENEPNKKALIKSLENSNLSIINNINSILNNETFNDTYKVKAMHSLVEIEKRNLKNILEQKSIFEAENLNRFDFIETISLSLQGKLSEVVKHIEFDEKSSNKNLIQAINYFKNNTNINKNAPIDFLDEDEQEAIVDGDKIKISLYKALLFIHISDGIKSGILNLKYSYKYKSFESYLIPKEKYKEQKDKLLKQYDVEHLKEFSDFLLPISEKLELNFSMTNRKIENELNIHFKITNNSFSLTTPKLEKSEEQIEHTISKYFPQSEFISVIDLLHSVQIKTDFLESFKHYSIQNVRTQKLDANLLFASIVGYGCNISLSKMAKISKGISENQLDNATTWYLSEENTIESNDKIVAFIDSLELPKILKNDSNINHTSSDGQKFNMKSSIASTNAGFSSKYFGTAKGVSVYTFIDESHKLFYSTVINANERESGYVIDGLMHNDVVKSDIHSTDTLLFIFQNMDTNKTSFLQAS